jgi:hypothetical protein
MCNVPLSRGKASPIAPREPLWEVDATRTSDSNGWIAMFLLIVALVVIGAGLSRRGAGLVILYLVVVIPALLAMLVSIARKKPDKSETGSLGESLLLLFAKFLKTVALLFLVTFGAVIALFVFCFLLLASHAIR